MQAREAAHGPVSELSVRDRGRPPLPPDDVMTKTIETIQAL